MDKSDDMRELVFWSGFLSSDTEAYTHRKRVSQRMSLLCCVAYILFIKSLRRPSCTTRPWQMNRPETEKCVVPFSPVCFESFLFSPFFSLHMGVTTVCSSPSPPFAGHLPLLVGDRYRRPRLILVRHSWGIIAVHGCQKSTAIHGHPSRVLLASALQCLLLTSALLCRFLR